MSAIVCWSLGQITYSRLDNVLGAYAAPLDICRVALTKDGDGLAFDDELSVLGLDAALEAAVDRVVLEHIDLAEHE